MASTWSREETIVAFYVYCNIPFRKSNKTHPTIVEYANIIGRTPSALNMKIGNIGRFDPTLKAQNITGLGHGAKMEEDIWNEFNNDPSALAYECEAIIAKLRGLDIESSAHIDTNTLPPGVSREQVVRQRINQSFFRNAVLSSYNFTCCISGVQNERLLEACHISSWADDERNRINPCNGICLNPFFHRAFDYFLISFNPDDYTIEISPKLIAEAKETSFKSYLESLQNRAIILPSRFFPDKSLLASHYSKFCQAL